MKKVWITGADGHVGTALLNLLDCTEYQILTTDIDAVDITDIDEVTQYVRVNRPDVIINCAGMTNVAKCEEDVDMAYKVNAIGVRNIALAAEELHARVIQMSTDDVFDQESRIPYNEFDQVHPKTCVTNIVDSVISDWCPAFKTAYAINKRPIRFQHALVHGNRFRENCVCRWILCYVTRAYTWITIYKSRKPVKLSGIFNRIVICIMIL